jgi:predicted ArsR family transcriptional regulator
MKITNRQANTLFVVAEYGPVTPAEVARHLLTTTEAERSRLAALEARAMVDAHYTHGGRGRAFTATDKGDAALSAHDAEWRDDE